MNFYSIFPDVNVLLALTVHAHPHHEAASRWWHNEEISELLLCRASQMGFLRLLTQRSALGDEVLTNKRAWDHLDQLAAAIPLRLLSDPPGLEKAFRAKSALTSISPKVWMDAYLGAFATQANIRLATFDIALARQTPRSVLLKH